MDAQQPTPPAAHRRSVRRRGDRHGRGLRRPLLPSAVPARRSPGERFDDLLQDAVDRLAQRCGPEVEQARFRSAMIPDRLEQRLAELDTWGAGSVDDPLGDTHRAEDGTALITVYRRPIEARAVPDGTSGAAADTALLAELIYATVVEQWAGLTGVSPESVDPDHLG